MTATLERNSSAAEGSLDYRNSHTAPEYGRRYQATYEHGYYHYQWKYLERDLLRHVLREVRKAGAQSCLDFACGTGRILRVAAELFPCPHGVDVSESMLEFARRDVPQAKLLRQDVTREPLDRQYDVVTAFRFFTNAEESLRREALRAIHQTLSPHGVFLANVHVNRDSLTGRMHRMRNWARGRTIQQVVGHDEFTALLAEHGFEVVRTHWYSFLPRAGWRFPWLARHFMRPVEFLCKGRFWMPQSLATSFLVECRKRPTTSASLISGAP